MLEHIVHHEIFSSDKGELLLAIRTKMELQTSSIKDLLLFGDVRAYMYKWCKLEI